MKIVMTWPCTMAIRHNKCDDIPGLKSLKARAKWDIRNCFDNSNLGFECNYSVSRVQFTSFVTKLNFVIIKLYFVKNLLRFLNLLRTLFFQAFQAVLCSRISIQT